MIGLTRFVLFASLLVAAGFARGDTASERLEKFLSDVKTLRASFVQTVYDEHHRELQRGSGFLLLSRPGRFRWTYIEPTEQIIVADGLSIWVHDVELDQVSVALQSLALRNTPAVLLAGGGRITDDFDVRDLGLERDYQWAEMTPHDQSGDFTRLRAGFGLKDLRVIEIDDRLGRTTRIEFRDVVRNLELDPKEFKFEPQNAFDVFQG
ncbi:MAG: outer membrane lipoprotein chaperone LolA [Chromatiales bacterium]|nr:outer membrane lipoprotein chaperone LolA [Chromatiales bacterium]